MSDFTDISEAEKFLNFSETTFSETMVPVQPQPTADSPHDPPTTAADSQDQITTVKTTPFKFPEGDNRDKEVDNYFSFHSKLYLKVKKCLWLNVFWGH